MSPEVCAYTKTPTDDCQVPLRAAVTWQEPPPPTGQPPGAGYATENEPTELDPVVIDIADNIENSSDYVLENIEVSSNCCYKEMGRVDSMNIPDDCKYIDSDDSEGVELWQQWDWLASTGYLCGSTTSSTEDLSDCALVPSSVTEEFSVWFSKFYHDTWSREQQVAVPLHTYIKQESVEEQSWVLIPWSFKGELLE